MHPWLLIGSSFCVSVCVCVFFWLMCVCVSNVFLCVCAACVCVCVIRGLYVTVAVRCWSEEALLCCIVSCIAGDGQHWGMTNTTVCVCVQVCACACVCVCLCVCVSVCVWLVVA